MDPPTNNGAGMASILVDSVNASSLKITATNPSSGKVVLTQDGTGTDTYPPLREAVGIPEKTPVLKI